MIIFDDGLPKVKQVQGERVWAKRRSRAMYYGVEEVGTHCVAAAGQAKKPVSAPKRAGLPLWRRTHTRGNAMHAIRLFIDLLLSVKGPSGAGQCVETAYEMRLRKATHGRARSRPHIATQGQPSPFTFPLGTCRQCSTVAK